MSETIDKVKTLEKKAKSGDAEAQFELAGLYHKGEGVIKNIDQAVKLLTKSAAQGYSRAQTNLAYMYQTGEGVVKDSAKAVYLYSKASKQGSLQALTNLAFMYQIGEGVDKDLNEAIKLYTKAAEHKYPYAQYNLALMYQYGEGVAKDSAKAIDLYSELAEQNHPEAQYNLAVMYQYGEGVEKDFVKAKDLYSKLVEQNDPQAQTNLAILYRNGEGVDKNLDEAINLYSKAAKQNCPQAQNNLASMFYHGEGVERNFEDAIEWYTKAAEQGNRDAQNNLATMYHIGKGEDKDLDKAIYWFIKAAKQGHQDAKRNLVYLYEPNVVKDKILNKPRDVNTKAPQINEPETEYNLDNNNKFPKHEKKEFDIVIQWYIDLAEQVIPEAQLKLAQIYYDGIGTGINFEEAYKWLLHAYASNPLRKNIGNLVNKCFNKKNKQDSKNFSNLTPYPPFKTIFELLQEIERIGNKHPDKTILYRGHADKNWDLIPTVHRNNEYKLKQFIENFENHYIQCFEKPLHTVETNDKKKEFETKTLMQHYEIPTDLLDWSYSPLSALYFALGVGGDFEKTPITDVCIWVAVTNSIHKIDNIDKNKINFLTTPSSNRRMQAQQGIFSYTEHKECLTKMINTEKDKKDDNELKLYRLCLENDFLGEKNLKYKQELNSLGVTPISMYPDSKGLKEEVIGYSKNIESPETELSSSNLQSQTLDSQHHPTKKPFIPLSNQSSFQT